MRRIRLVLLAALFVLGVGGIIVVQVAARNNLRQSIDLSLLVLSQQIEGELIQPRDDLTSLASSTTVREFVRLVNLPSGLRTDTARQSQETMIGFFADLLEQRGRRYSTLRLLRTDGSSWGQVTYGTEGELVITTGVTTTDAADDPAFQHVIEGLEPGEVYFSAIQPASITHPQGSLNIYVPVSSVSSPEIALGVLQLQLQADTLISAFTAAQANVATQRQGRHIFLTNASNEIIIRTREVDEDHETREQQTLAEIPGDLTGDFTSATEIYSTRIVEGLRGYDMPWRVVIEDNVFGALLNAHIISALVGILYIVVTAVVMYVLNIVLRPVVTPLREASTLVGRLAVEGEDSHVRVGVPLDNSDALLNSIAHISHRIDHLSSAAREQGERRSRELQMISRISRDTARLHDLDQLLERAVNLICDELGYYHAQVFLLDDAGLSVYMAYSRGELGRDLMAQHITFPRDAANEIGSAVRGQIKVDNLVREDHGALLPETRAVVALPLIADQTPIGVLHIQSKRAGVFGDDQMPVLTLLADQLASAIHNTRLITSANQRARQADALNRRLTRGVWEQQIESDTQQPHAYQYNLIEVQPLTNGSAAPVYDAHALTAPISIRGETIGLLAAAPGDGQEFTEGDEVILRAVAERVALAIENARLFQETQVTLAETSKLYTLSRRLNEAHTLEEVIRAILESVIPDAASGQLWVFDDYPTVTGPQWMQLVVDHAIAERDSGSQTTSGMRLHLPDHPFLKTLRSDVVALSTHLRDDPRLDSGLKLVIRRMGGSAVVFIPLNLRGIWRGLITVAFAERRDFTEQEGRIFTALIDQAGVAIDNRLLLQQTEEALTRNENLYAASRIINQAQTMGDLVYAVVATNEDPSLRFELSLLEGDLDETGWPSRARIVAQSEGRAIKEVDILHPIFVPQDSAMRVREPEIISDLHPTDPDAPMPVRWIREQGYRFSAVFPLFSANQPIALFSIRSEEVKDLLPGDYEVYRALTGQMSTQLQIRRLLVRTEQALDETRRLYIASRAIASAQDSDAVYRAASEHLVRPFLPVGNTPATQTIRVSLFLAYPEATPRAPYMECVSVWSSDPAVTGQILVGQRFPSSEYPFEILLEEYDGLITIDDLTRSETMFVGHPELYTRLRSTGSASALIAPVQSRLRWFGALLIESDRTNAFNEQYQRFVQAIADQVSIAVENQMLFRSAQLEAERAQQEAQRALALAEAAQLASRSMIGVSFAESLGEVFERVALEAGLDRWMLLLFDDRRTRLNLITSKIPSMELATNFQYSPDTTLPVVQVTEIRRPLLVNAVDEYPGVATLSDTIRRTLPIFFGKHIAAPVTSAGEVLGALMMGRSIEAEDLDERDEQLVVTVAAQVALALENRRLFQQAQNEQQRLRSILETLPAGVLVLNPELLTPVVWNQQIETYLGRPIDPLLPFSAQSYSLYRTGTQLIYPADEMPILVALQDDIRTFGDDLAVVRDDGKTDLLINAAPIHDASGQISAIVAAFQDISNLRSLENTLQENLRETVALYEAQRQLSEANELEEVLDVVITQLALLQPDDAYIFLTDDDNRLRTVRHLSQPLDDPTVLAGVFSPEDVVQIAGAEISELPATTRDALTSLGMRELISVPMRASGRTRPLGWLMALNDAPGKFTPDQERIIGQLGDVASTAIDNRYLIRSQQATLQEIGALYNATTTISRTRDLGQLSVVLQAALATLQPDYMLGYVETDNRASVPLELFAVSPPQSDVHVLRTMLAEYNIPSEGIYIENLAEAMISQSGSLKRDLLSLGDVRSLAAINLRIKDRPGGRLIVAFRNTRRFTEGESRYLNTIADSASVVIDNILLFEQIQSTLEETSVLYQASRALTEASTAEDILNVVVNYLIQPHTHQVFIALLNTTTWENPHASVDIVSTWNDQGSLDLTGLSLTQEQFPAWALLASPTVVTIDDVNEDLRLDEFQRMGAQSLDVQSLAIIPLRVPKRAIGAVWLGSRDPHIHNERELRVYQAFAEQASLSLEASYLLQQIERRARQLETSAQVSQRAGNILDLEVLLPQVVSLIRDAFRYDHVQIFLMDEQNDFAELRASTGEAGQQLLGIKHKLRRGSQSVIGQVTATSQPHLAQDTADVNVIHQPNPYLPLTRSEMALPLIIKGKVIGALDVQSNQPNAFSDEDVSALTTLAAQIAVAIDNANLYEATQEQANKMGFLFDITTAAAAADSLNSSLQLVADRLHHALDALSVSLYLPHFYIDRTDNPYIMMQAVALAGSDQPLAEIAEIRSDDPTNIISHVVETMQPHIVEDAVFEPRYLPIVPEAKSAILVPLMSGPDLIGLINVESRQAHAFGYDMLQLLLTLAGSLSAIIKSAQLLDQLSRTNEQLRELDRLKSDFLANMSHELRTPLNSIIGFSRVMLKGIDGPLTEMQEQDLTTIYNSGQHLLVLINDILDQAKIAAGKMDLKLAYFDIKPVVEAVKSIGIGLVKDKPIQIHMEIANNLPKVYGDEFRTRQVLLNLVSNASKFTNQGSIVIRVYPITHAETGKTIIRLDVTDSGIGIAEKDIPLLFEAFRQVDSSLTRTVGGTGLGLPIAKSLIELQGGEMMVASKVNVGSTFSITIPTEPVVIEHADDDLPGIMDFGKTQKITQEVDQFNPPSKPTLEVNAVRTGPSQRAMQSKRQVVLIEDNKDMVDMFRRILQREGFEVISADHPAYAEAMVSNLRPTVVVMDVSFADGEGWNILTRLKDRDDTFDLPVIVVTLSSDSQRAYQSGAHTFIQRPFMPEDLVAAVLEAEKESNTDRILIIDDQPEAIRLLTQLLNENGRFRVFAAHSAEDGIALVARRRPDLVLLDLRMPDKDGFAVLEELRSNPETANIPVMVITGEVTFNPQEKAQLSNVHVLYKAHVTEQDYQRFIEDVQAHLNDNQQP